MSPERMTAQEREHEEVNLLLPWYQNATLAAGERARVEAHLAACAPCRGELALVQDTAQAVRELDEAEPAPAPWAYARLEVRMNEAEAARLPNRLAAWWAALWQQPVPVPVFRRAAVGVFAVLLAQAVVIGGLALRERREAYRVLGGPSACQAPAACLQVVFTETATEAAIRQALLKARVQIVEGPSALGRYTLALNGGGAAPEAVERALAALREDGAVVKFAERAP